VLLGVAQSDTLNMGYVIDTLVLSPTYYARLLATPAVLASLPREGNSPILTGNTVQFAGLTFLKSTNLPSGVNVMVLDSTQLGSIGFEELGGGYTGSAHEVVQSKVFRKEHNDGFRIQARLVRVPMIQEPGAAVKLTGLVRRASGRTDYVYKGQLAPKDAVDGEIERLFTEGYLAQVEVVDDPDVAVVTTPASQADAKPLEEMTAEELTRYAEDHGIDTGRATSVDGLLAKINEGQPA
jgi:hypothetical protein